MATMLHHEGMSRRPRTGDFFSKQIRETIFCVLGQIAPEADLSQIQPNLRIRDQLDINSTNLLNWVVGLHIEFKIDIPETDYPTLATLDDRIHYPAVRRELQ